MIKKYEVMFILDQDVKNVEELADKYNKILSANGKIVETNNLGLLDFAYEINHKKKGHYIVSIVETNTVSIQEFERLSGIDKSVVRSLVLNTENIQNWEQSIKLSKTDMSKYEEERREKRNFRKPFTPRNNNANIEKAEVKEEQTTTASE